jgi:serine/threonine-protein kinase
MREYVRADSLVDRSIALSLDDPTLYGYKLINLLSRTGETDKANSVLERALGLRGWRDHIDLIDRLLHVKMWDRGYAAALNLVVTVFPAALDTHFRVLSKAQLIAQIYALHGEHELARAYYDSARAYLEGKIEEQADDERLYSSLGIVNSGLGRDEEAVRAAKKGLELLPVSRDALVGPEGLEPLAQVYTMTGDHEAAIDQLEMLLSTASLVTVRTLRVDPTWDPLRDHPRFRALLERS